MLTLFALLVVFQLKHFLADYPFQTPYMLKKGSGGMDWVLPLAAHAAVHATMTFVIALFVRPALAFPLAGIDFCTHFIVDRIKASPSLGGRFTPAQPKFWWALGADQMAHHLTHYAIIASLLHG
jgi:hypothetical protein